MRFFQFYHNAQPSAATHIFTLIFLANVHIQFCKASYSSASSSATASSSSNTGMQCSTPKECARACQDGESPKYCCYKFVLELYATMGAACDICQPPVNRSDVAQQTCECILGDGWEKTVFTINRMIPGPSIQVCKNDVVKIDVKNEAEGMEVAIHWHGIFQKGYQYYDGVPFVTQCPIHSSNSFTYEFRCENAGTHFYHSHISSQMIDGQYGSFIVRSPPSSDPYSDQYERGPLNEKILLISDWYHEFSVERNPGRYRGRGKKGQDADNILINGKGGDWTDPNTGNSNNISLSTFIVQPGKRYRFRMINACSTVCLEEITIEGHFLRIISTDGENVVAKDVDAIVMATGERVDFILHANQNPGYYWIHVRGLGECEKTQIYQLAILIYEGSSSVSLSPRPGYSVGSNGKLFNPVNSTDCETNVCVNNLCKYPSSENAVPLNTLPDQLFVLSFDFFNYSNQGLWNLFKPTAEDDYKRFFVAIDKSHLDSLVNNISYGNPPSPLISQNEAYQYICEDSSTPSTCTEPCTCTHVLHVPLGNTVDIMVYDRQPQTDLNHPFHLHGYSFCVMLLSQFNDADNKTLISDNDIYRVLLSYREMLLNGTFNCCSPKDTTIVPNTGYFIIRFKADNPGWWFFHCHFTWHTVTGMNIVIHVGQPNDLPPVPQNFPKCNNWSPNNQNNINYYNYYYYYY